MHDEAEAHEATGFESRSALPPLRVHHLMAWMTVAAVLISVSLWFDRTARNGPPIEDPIVVASLILGAVAIAGAWTCFGLGFYWRRQGFMFPKQPGDWLLAIVAASTIALVAALLGIFLAFFIDHDLIAIYYALAAVVLLLLWIRLNARGMSFYSDTYAWGMLFGAMAVVLPVAVILESTILVAALLVCLAWAGWSDLRVYVVRGWTHWFGVGMALSLAVALMGVLGRW